MDNPKGVWFHRQWPSIMGGERKRERPSRDGAEELIPPIITQSVSLYFFTSHICQSILGLISYTFPDLFCTRVRFLAPEDRLDLDLLEENKLRVKLC